ncbi:hypothetical protein JOD54_001843 [Actinokineospora baliensis]|uniref:hypothetical protein n=1 Tax=Actinokineospora baliensis TaxID=547056 RepID=UPI00195AF7F1|nr:hypothetical protein [Actinokineospora baliensis]MBM7771639.1 hypothetical protein [Actinokineospora baliensis]
MGDARNSLPGKARDVVQAHEVGDVVFRSHDRRGVYALAALAVVLVAAIVVIVLQPTQAPPVAERGPLVAAVTGNTGQDSGWCTSGWIIPDRGDAPIPYSGGPPPGAVEGGGTVVAVTVQGLTGKAVVLQGMSVDVVRRSPAPTGVYLPPVCPAHIVPRKYGVALDNVVPRVVADVGTRGFPYRVSETEPEVFVIHAGVDSGDVQWRLVLAWTSGAEKGELVVDDNGRPFHTVALSSSRPFCVSKVETWQPAC